MIKQLIDYINGIASKHKLVNTTKYIAYQDINNQHNNKYYEFLIEDEARIEKQITEGIITIDLNIDVLAFLTKDLDNLTAQDNCLHILLDVLQYVKTENSQLELRDYSIASFSKYTDDNCSGIRATIELIIPSPINLCEYKNNFEDKEIEPEEEDTTLSNGDDCTGESFNTDGEFDLNPLDIGI